MKQKRYAGTAKLPNNRRVFSLLAAKANVPSDGVWRSAYVVPDSAYASQGWGARKYARSAAEVRLLDYKQYVLNARVEEQFHPFDQPVRCAGGDTIRGWYEYHVMVPATGLGLAILRRKPGLPLRDFVRSCWKAGVNPRVSQPFLPADYEAQVGLDHWGGELPAITARAG